MIFTKHFALLISLMLISTTLFAGDTPVARTPDISNGKTIAAGTCSACHGADGNSMIPMYPSLAGQHAAYLTKQLSEFKSGVRANAVMGPMATMLSDTDMADVSAFYASQKATLKNPARVTSKLEDCYILWVIASAESLLALDVTPTMARASSANTLLSQGNPAIMLSLN